MQEQAWRFVRLEEAVLSLGSLFLCRVTVILANTSAKGGQITPEHGRGNMPFASFGNHATLDNGHRVCLLRMLWICLRRIGSWYEQTQS